MKLPQKTELEISINKKKLKRAIALMAELEKIFDDTVKACDGAAKAFDNLVDTLDKMNIKIK